MNVPASTCGRACRSWLAAVAVSLLAPAALASGIQNGDFTGGLSSWSIDGNSVEAKAGGGDFFALLTLLASDSTSSCEGVVDFDRCLFQAFAVAASGGESLAFDFSFSTESADGSGKDTFAVSILSDDGMDPSADILAVDESFGVVRDPFAQGLTVHYTPGPVVDGFDAFANGTTHSGRITVALPSFLDGDSVKLYFDLLEGATAHASRVGIDNVSVAVLRLPEPGSLVLILGGLLAVAGRARDGAS